MRSNPLRAAMAAGNPVVNAWVSCGDGYLAEVLSHAGYDAVTIDLQHGMFGMSTAVRLLQAVSAGPAVPMVRSASQDPSALGKLLDAGAYGVICPGVDSAEQAAAFVAACRYPPQGVRSYGPSRGLLYGGADYLDHADDTVLTWAMVESAAGLSDLDRLLAVEGLDGIYVGPSDLALSLGERPGATEPGPLVRAALEQVASAARAAGRWCGVFCTSGEQARQLVEVGYHLVTPGNDVSLLRQAAGERVAAARGRPTNDRRRNG